MSSRHLLVFVFLVWCLWVFAASMQVAVENARNPLPGGGRRGVSPAPAIPVCPLVFWGAARGLDLVVDPWGTRIIGSLHAIFAAALLSTIVLDSWRLLAMSKHDSPS